MLQSMASLLRDIEVKGLGEADIYRLERLYEHRPAPFRRGVLTCPICGTQATRFARFGIAGRRNAQCPVCGSVERHRFIWLYVTRHTDLLRGRYSVIHTAAEPCLEQRLRGRPNLRYRSLDLFDPRADIRADLTDLPFDDASVDVVLSFNTIEHIPDDRAALREIARVLRPAGWALINVPMNPKIATEDGPDVESPAERLRRFGHPYHYHLYGAAFGDRLVEAGLRATRIGTREWLPPHQRRRYRLNRNYLFHCVKPAR